MAKVTKKQAAYAEQRARGLTRDQSALMAGYSNTEHGTEIEKSDGVKQELARIRAETAANCGITKEDVVKMLVDAAAAARLMSDPSGLVAAARELGKMLGFYAPEKPQKSSINKDELKKALEEMGDEELLRIANARVIDGEARRVGNEGVSDVQQREETKPVLSQERGMPKLSAAGKGASGSESGKTPPREDVAGGNQEDSES